MMNIGGYVNNEIGVKVPPEIAEKAKELGCMKGVMYVYREGEYGPKKFPASSIGGLKASRFKSFESANTNKVKLGAGWVAFKSPSYGGIKVSGSRYYKDTSVGASDKLIIGGFDGADDLWKYFEEHRKTISSEVLRKRFTEILQVGMRLKRQHVQCFSRRDGFSFIIKGLKVVQVKLKNNGFVLILIKYASRKDLFCPEIISL